ncbi:MAG: hypothetical protein ABI921_11725 [Panacibacter sp.]
MQRNKAIINNIMLTLYFSAGLAMLAFAYKKESDCFLEKKIDILNTTPAFKNGNEYSSDYRLFTLFRFS